MKIKNILLVVITLLFSFTSYAGISLGGTRLVYDGSKKEASISISNSSQNVPYLVQSWVEGSNDRKEKIPFIVTPPLFKLENNSSNMIRVMKLNNDFSQDRESLFTLNIKAIPATEKDSEASKLIVSTQNVVKLIYRPAGLNAKDANKAYEQLQFSVQGNQLVINNPTPFIVNVGEFKVNNELNNTRLTILPFSKEEVTLKSKKKISSVSIKAINDYGGMTSPLTKTF